MVPMVEEKPVVEYFFDTSCPWSYLALERVRDAALRTSARIVYRPVLVDDLLRRVNPDCPVGRTDPLPVRARYQAKDLADWARYCGLTLRRPEPWPLRAEWAQRGSVVAAASGQSFAYLLAMFAALFGTNRRIDQRAVVEAVAAEAGLDAQAFAAGLDDRATLTQVEANGTSLLARGGFGTPTLLVGDDLYFGNDRLPLVEAALARQGEMRLVLPGAHGA